MSPPFVTIVMATYNAAATLPRCLDSLRMQTFRGFEVVVMDGGSTDGTVDILKSAGDVVTHWHSERDRGIYHAWNKALAHAHGEWICFLGGDDRLHDAHALERIIPFLRNPGSRRVVYGRLRQVDEQGRVVAEIGEPWERAKGAFRAYRCLPHSGLMHHRSLFELHGPFDESLRIAADYEFLLRELKDRDALFAPVPVVDMTFGGQSTQPENLTRMYGEVRSALARHGLKPPAMRWALITGVARVYDGLRSVLGDRAARRLADLFRVLTLRKPRYGAPSRE